MKQKFKAKNTIFFIYPQFVNFAQHLQNDKVYHRKEQKISYPEVYLVALSLKVQGRAVFGHDSTGLVGYHKAVKRLAGMSPWDSNHEAYQQAVA